MHRNFLPIVLALALVALVPTAANAASSPPHSAGAAKLNVGVDVLKFSARGRQVTARGLVTARLTDSSGQSTTIHQTIALSAKTGGSCRVLHLFLDQLDLKLLGLNAHLDRVTLDITGNRRGGVLGSLFCRLAKGASNRNETVRALNAGLRHRQHALRFNADISPQAKSAATGPTCQVLNLIVGPLNLQLLGLIVDLDKVTLNVNATRGQGKLGDLFCQLADSP